MSHFLLFRQLLESRLERRAVEWFREAAREVSAGPSPARFSALLAMGARHARRAPLAPDAAEEARVSRAVEGLSIERWSVLDALRAALVLARGDLAEETGALAVEEAFRYADEGEAVALYRTLALLPAAERFAGRAREGCRSNMKSVFEAAALDTPVPFRLFDDAAWNQAAIKCLFLGAPLWRMWGLDARLSPELARMALDLADERRSARRPVPPALWLCLGAHGGERGTESLARELDPANFHVHGRRAAAYGLARAGEIARLEARAAAEQDPVILGILRDAHAGATSAAAFRALDPVS
ncbi:MAG: EboA domain-containing protein [Planctomycetota bacterium]